MQPCWQSGPSEPSRPCLVSLIYRAQPGCHCHKPEAPAATCWLPECCEAGSIGSPVWPAGCQAGTTSPHAGFACMIMRPVPPSLWHSLTDCNINCVCDRDCGAYYQKEALLKQQAERMHCVAVKYFTGSGVYTARSKWTLCLILAITLPGFKPLGHTLAQFMI